MRNVVVALVGIGLSFNLFAAEIDLEAVMKEINLHYKKATRAETIEEMQSEVASIEALVAKAKEGEYSPERNTLYQEGFQKLTVAFGEVGQSLASGDLDAAKGQLRDINDLKKEYHKAAKDID